ncbi:MAG TPA: biotin/lipoyl-binding protein, partial [Aliiroseovarius sp.]|nr:biotin/lipoyl-binding protein [Aliiroseovarius sp.]
LPRAQDDITLTGHAFEARIYAEDVPAGFLPATGRLTHLRFPEGVRIDTGVRAGDVISPHYDPMIAKLTSFGATRASALRRLTAALDRSQVGGLTTNLGFLAALARQSDFAAGRVDTGLIARHQDALTGAPQPTPADLAMAALAASGLADMPGSGFTLWQPVTRRVGVAHGGEVIEMTITTIDGAQHRVCVGGARITATRLQGQWELDGVRAPGFARTGSQVTVFSHGGLVFDILDPLEAGTDTGQDASAVLAPMPGLVRDIACAPGQEVEEGMRLVVLEAMKMEHVLRAPRAGVVAEVLTETGQQVEAGQVLIRLEEAADG